MEYDDDVHGDFELIEIATNQEIKYASLGESSGKRPSHWIAVRANLHMTRQYFRLKKLNQCLSLSL